MAKILLGGLYAMGSRSIGLNTQKASMLALRKKRSARGEAYGRGATLCLGPIGRA